MSVQHEFDEIYQRYAADLYRYLLSLCRDEALAMDLLQDTMLRAFTEFDRFRGDCAVKTWLCTIARNLYRDHLRKAGNSNLPLDESAELLSDDISFAEQLETHDTAMQIHRLLHRLDEPHREIFSLRVFAELSFRDIGGLFGQSEAWARVTFFRAKKKLITWMNEEDAS